MAEHPAGRPHATAWPGLADPRFFERAGPFTLADIALACGAQVRGQAKFFGVAPLQSAGPAEVSFLHNRRYLPALAATRAGAVIVSEALAAHVPATAVALTCPDPHLGWARVAALFHPLPPAKPGVHPGAHVEAGAEIGPGCEIAAGAVIGAGAVLGANSRVGAGAVVGAGVATGQDCRIGALASLSHALLGDRVYVYPGARIGQEGFGFAITDRGFVTVPQLGRVILEDDVEIGANSTVDRGAATDTVIGAGSRIDNLVQIGHNVRLGRCCVVVAQAGISGSTVLGDFVQVGAQAGLTGHLSIGARARIGAQCGVMSDVAAGAEVLGSPAMPVREFFRNVAVLRRLARRQGREQASADGRNDA